MFEFGADLVRDEFAPVNLVLRHGQCPAQRLEGGARHVLVVLRDGHLRKGVLGGFQFSFLGVLGFLRVFLGVLRVLRGF